jgi:transposase
VIETCTEAFRIAGKVQQLGHDVRVVAATLVRSLGVGQRGLKNDVRDARTLSEASCRIELPSVHIPSAVSQEVKAICVSRETLVKARTQLVSRVRSYVRSRIGPLRATPDSLPKKVRRTLLKDVEGLPAHLDRLLTALEILSDQIADADAELKELAGKDERMRRLMTVPGIGPVTAARFVAANRHSRAVPECVECRVVSRPHSERRHHRLPDQTETTDESRRPSSSMGARTGRLVVVSSTSSRSHGPVDKTGRRTSR